MVRARLVNFYRLISWDAMLGIPFFLTLIFSYSLTLAIHIFLNWNVEVIVELFVIENLNSFVHLLYSDSGRKNIESGVGYILWNICSTKGKEDLVCEMFLK